LINKINYMGNNKAPVFTLTIVSIIVGVSLFKLIDFATFKVEKPALAVVYLVTFVGSVYVLIKSRKRNSEK
jgi:hypothetical protein